MSLLELKAIENLKELQKKTGKNLISVLVNLYVETTPSLIDNMKGYLVAKQYDDLSREAHSLKSSSANLGVYKIREFAEKIELSIINDTKNDNNLNEDIKQIEKAYTDVKEELMLQLAKTA